MRRLSEWIGYLVAAVVVGALLLHFRLMGDVPRIEVPLSDRSMRPAIGAEATDFAVDPSWNAKPERMAVVAFVPPGGGSPKVARVVALQGDTLEVVKGVLHVNGTPPKDMTRSMPVPDVQRLKVPRDCAYLLTDTERGLDSIELGPVPLWRILGSVKH